VSAASSKSTASARIESNSRTREDDVLRITFYLLLLVLALAWRLEAPSGIDARRRRRRLRRQHRDDVRAAEDETRSPPRRGGGRDSGRSA
jgi:hypothetical protein